MTMELLAVSKSIAHKLIAQHSVDGEMVPGNEISIRIDRTQTQDATGTRVKLALRR